MTVELTEVASHWSGLSSDTKPITGAPGSTFTYPNGDVDLWSGTSWINIASGGASRTTTSTGLGVVTPREMDISSGEDTATFTEAEDVTHIIYELDGAAGDSAFITFDAPDPATQTANLAKGGTSSTAALREKIIVGERYEKFFPAGAPLRQIGATRNGGTGTVISIVAGK